MDNLYRGSHPTYDRLYLNFDVHDIAVLNRILEDSMSVPEITVFAAVFDVVELLTGATIIARSATMFTRVFGLETQLTGPSNLDSAILQAPLVLYSVLLFVKTATPIIRAFFSPVTELDMIAYSRLFKPIGLSWIQFKVILTEALDWVYIEPFTIIQNEGRLGDEDESENDYLYWLYKGNVTVSYNNAKITTLERKTGKGINDPGSVGLIADMRFLYRLDQRLQKVRKQKKMILNYIFKNENEIETENEDENENENEDALLETMSMSTYTAGSQGVEVLRIDTKSLLNLIEVDEGLEQSFKLLLLKSVQRKVVLYLKKISDIRDELENISTHSNREMIKKE